MSESSSPALVAVVGAGTMGAGIAQVAAQAGHRVLLFDTFAGAAARALEQIGASLARLVERGKLDASARDALLGRITPCTALAELKDATLVIEAIIEDLAAKQQLFRELEEICADDAVLASNSSSISITAIAAALRRPERFLGMHFFNPAPLMQLVEIISGLATDRDVSDQVFTLAASWGKRPVHVRSTPGFIVNRVARPFYGEALRAAQEGAADRATIDAVLKQAGGFRMGPFELMDLIGNDINYAVTCSVFAAYYQDPRYQPSLLQKELNDAGFLGRKSQRGHYRYGAGAVNSEPVSAAAAAAPRSVAHGSLGSVTAPLATMARAAGIEVTTDPSLPDNGWRVGAWLLLLSDGRCATQLAAATGNPNVALHDIALDFTSAERIAICRADQATVSLDPVIGFWQALGKAVSVIDDFPGLLLLRTVCMLANEGAEAVHQHICTAAGVDAAMQAGVNYPRGPLAWAEQLGLAQVVHVLDALNDFYRDPRYRASPLLRRRALAHMPLLTSSR
ncbi:MAG: 3-hydroxyacyl-CoA dehydrogenase [Gammaproteobacteria bacterium]|nr:3-hydroxyacyl-CoA dehydrogenase [Gammaproteobacteria bacterium]